MDALQATPANVCQALVGETAKRALAYLNRIKRATVRSEENIQPNIDRSLAGPVTTVYG